MYHENGKIKVEGTYTNGKLHSIDGSICKGYYKNGNILVEGTL